MGWSVGGAGDVNKDGYADLIVGAPPDDNNGRTDSGSARVFSGEWIDSAFKKRTPKTKQILWTVDGDSAGDRSRNSSRSSSTPATRLLKSAWTGPKAKTAIVLVHGNGW